jgi:hypothetical protein
MFVRTRQGSTPLLDIGVDSTAHSRVVTPDGRVMTLPESDLVPYENQFVAPTKAQVEAVERLITYYRSVATNLRGRAGDAVPGMEP